MSFGATLGPTSFLLPPSPPEKEGNLKVIQLVLHIYLHTETDTQLMIHTNTDTLNVCQYDTDTRCWYTKFIQILIPDTNAYPKVHTNTKIWYRHQKLYRYFFWVQQNLLIPKFIQLPILYQYDTTANTRILKIPYQCRYQYPDSNHTNNESQNSYWYQYHIPFFMALVSGISIGILYLYFVSVSTSGINGTQGSTLWLPNYDYSSGKIRVSHGNFHMEDFTQPQQNMLVLVKIIILKLKTNFQKFVMHLIWV